MSWQMKMKLRPSRSWRSSSRSSIWRAERDVERRGRLVGDDDARVERDRAGDADALPLAAGEGVRIALHHRRVEPDQAQQLGDPVLELAPVRSGR